MVRKCQACFNLAIEMLVISGENGGGEPLCRFLCFNLAIEMLIISGSKDSLLYLLSNGFNLAIEMLVISGHRLFARGGRQGVVSISQSRCLSFQVGRQSCLPLLSDMFQSRNRDACHFRLPDGFLRLELAGCFNLAIEILVISGGGCGSGLGLLACFNLAIEMLVISGKMWYNIYIDN